MHERMLDKKNTPNENEINDYIGKKSVEHIHIIKDTLEKAFDDLNLQLRFPYGNDYGWGYKFSHKTKHLFDLFFEKGSISVLMQISKIKTEKEIERYNKLSEEGKKYWENRYPCGKNGGGWINYRIVNKKQLKDIMLFLSIKTNNDEISVK